MNRAALVRRVLVAMLLGVLLYAGFVALRGFRDIGARLGTFAWSSFALALLLSGTNYLLRFLKWEFYLARLGIRGIPKGDSFLTFLAGFVLTVTPGKVGEVFKSLVLEETYGIPIARTAPIVIAERLTDLLGVIALVLAGSFAFPGGLPWALAGTLAVIFGIALVASSRVLHAVVSRLERGTPFFRRLAPRLREAWDTLRLLTRPQLLLWPALLSVASWSLEAFALGSILRGLGTPVSEALARFVYATSTLAGALIPVPGGLGVTEGSLEQQLVRLGGVPLAAATSAMILGRLATLWFAVFLGFGALAWLRRRHPTLLAAPPPSSPSLAAPVTDEA